jgi:hypothetical protein
MDATTTATTTIDLSSVDLSAIANGISSVVPTALGLIIPVLAIRKTISFLVGMVQGA